VRAFYEDLWTRLPDELGRDELQRRARFLRNHLEPGDRVLDLGCGDGAWAAEAPPAGQWTGADIAEAALERARRVHPEGQWVRIAEEAPLPFATGSFDVVWCSETLEHVGDTARFLAEARRVLHPDGVLLVTVPDHPRLRRALRALVAFERAFPPLGDHLRFYTIPALRDALADADLARVEIERSGPLLLASARR